MAKTFRFYGGKSRLASWIVFHFPHHKTYVEAFGGSASVLLTKPPSNLEIYNDKDERLVTLFRVLRNKPEDLIYKVQMTLYAQTEFQEAQRILRNPSAYDEVDVAWAVLVVIYQSMGCIGRNWAREKREVSRTAQWKKLPEKIQCIVENIKSRNLLIENGDAINVIERYDSEDTLIYCDPPYLPSTRKAPVVYAYEMSEEDHIKLLETLLSVKGKVVLSGYDNPLYNEYLKGWHKSYYKTITTAFNRSSGEESSRIKVLWMNFPPTCILGQERGKEKEVRRK